MTGSALYWGDTIKRMGIPIEWPRPERNGRAPRRHLGFGDQGSARYSNL